MQTRKFPRTMNEAFGPYASGPITEPVRPMDWQDKVVLAGCVGATLFFIGALLVEWIV